MKILGLGALLTILLTGVADAGTWIKAESAHFIVYSDNDDAKTRTFVAKLEAFNALSDDIYREIGDSELPDSGKFTVLFVKNFGENADLQMGRVYGPQAAVGCPTEGIIYVSVLDPGAVSTASQNYNRETNYLFYSLALRKTWKYFSHPIPGWVGIGLPVYLSDAAVSKDKIIVGYPPHGLIMDPKAEKAKIPFAAALNGALPKTVNGSYAYILNWTMISFFMSDPLHRGQLGDFLSRIDSGLPSLTAFKAATHLDTSALDDVFHTYVVLGPPQVVFENSQPNPTITVTQLPAYDAPIPLIHAEIEVCPDTYKGESLLSQARKTAKAFPTDDLAQMTYAHALVTLGSIKKGEPEAALAILQRSLAIHPNDLETQELLGRLYLTLAREGPSEQADSNYALARKTLGKAYQLDPIAPSILYFYIMAHENLPTYPDAETMQAFDLAQEYSGNVYFWLGIELAVKRGDYDGAAQKLTDDCTYCDGLKAPYRAIRTAILAKRPSAEIVLLINSINTLYTARR